MKTSKIYFENNEISSNEYLKSVYTIPNDFQLVHFSLNSGGVLSTPTNRDSDSGQVYTENESSQFIQITSGTGELIINYAKTVEKFELKPNSNFIIPKNVKFTITAKESLTGIILFDKQQFPSDYSIMSTNMKSKEDFIKEYGTLLVNTVTQRESKSKSASEVVELFISSDPSRNKKFTDWLIKSYIRGGISRIEDLSRAIEALIDFNYLLDNKKFEKGYGDINNYFGLISGTEKGKIKFGLEKVIDEYAPQLESLRNVKKQKIESKESGKEGGKLVFENDKATVIQPLTTEGACYYGRGTKWCTASTKGENMFSEYSKDGPMYIIFPKKQGHPTEKYQFHHFSEQYMNELDEEVDPLWLFDKFDLPQEIPKAIIEFPPKNKELYSKYEHIIQRVYLDYPPIEKINFSDDFYKKVVELKINSQANVVYIFNDIIYKMTNLTKLIMRDLNLNKIPKSVYQMTKLTKLAISGNKIGEIESIGNLINLEILNIGNNQLTSLPETIGNLTNLKYLDIGNNQLTILPETIGNLTNLIELHISANKIKYLPNNVTNLVKLKFLHSNDNLLYKLPDSFGNLINLNEIWLSENKLKTLPNSITKLVNLDKLHISDNEITELPDSFGNLTKLTKLWIYNNELSELPYSIGKLINVTDLEINNNLLTNLPNTIKNLVNLEYLDISNNKIIEFNEVHHFTKLIDLTMNNNTLIELPKEIGKLVNLETLNLSDNPLTELPEEIGNLVNLTELNISDTFIKKLPESIGNLFNLDKLIIMNVTELKTLPNSIGKLTNLTVLTLVNNDLTELPETIGNLINLKYLNIFNNNLTELPETIGNLIKLKELYISNNKLSELPDSMKNLINLKKLEIYGNKITKIPESLQKLPKLKIIDKETDYIENEYNRESEDEE